MFLGVRAFTPSSVFRLSEMDALGLQKITKVGDGGGTIIHSQHEGIAKIRVVGPLREKLEIYTVTSCAGLNNVKTFNY